MMGFDIIGFVIFFFFMMPCFKGMNSTSTSTSTQLDDMFQEYAHNSLPTHPQTGVVYNASSLPSNFTGIQVSMVRLRWDSFRGKGANYSAFHMPPHIFAYPYFTRLDIVYSDLGNQSSYYYNVPNHTLVAPVLGFNIYGNLTTKLNLTLFGGPILIQFELPLPLPQKPKCVMFFSNGTFEMSNMTQQDMCAVRDQGHFSMVIPAPSTSMKEKERGTLWKWWVFGFTVGVLGLLLIVFVTTRIFRMRNIGKMDKEAETNEGLDTTNVGQSKMPVATLVRTQPIIENDYVP